MLEVRESDLCMRSDAAVACATAGDREGIIGYRGFDSSLCMPTNSLNSSGSFDVDACARDPALLVALASLSSPASAPASLAVVAHARSTPMHVAHNSWSDTGRVQGPTGRVPTWVHITREHRHSGQRLSCSVEHFPSRGRARWVEGWRWRLSRRRQSSEGVCLFYFFLYLFGGTNFALFLRVWFLDVPFCWVC